MLLALPGADSAEWPVLLAGQRLSPLRATLLGTAGVWLWLYRQTLHAGTGLLAAAMIVAAGAGHSPDSMWATLRAVTPTTLTGWGVAAVAAAFGLLFLGALQFLARPESTDDPSPNRGLQPMELGVRRWERGFRRGREDLEEGR